MATTSNTIDPVLAYKRLVLLIAREKQIPEAEIWPDEHLLGEVGFTPAGLRDFTPRINGAFTDYNLNLSRSDVVKCDLILDLANLIADKINGKA